MQPQSAEANRVRYFLVFATIAAMIFVAVGISFMGEVPHKVAPGATHAPDVNTKGGTRLVLNLVVASVQVALLGLIFMHLKNSDRLTWLVVGAGLFWILILFLLLLTDYLTRQYGVY